MPYIIRSARASIIVLLLIAFVLHPALAADQITMHVILTRVSTQAEYLVDATNVVSDLAQRQVSKSVALQTIESEVLERIAARTDDVKDATPILIRVVYEKNANVSPTYQTATFSGVEKLMQIRVSGGRSQLRQTAALLAQGKAATGVSIQVTGDLPPEISGQ